MRIAEPLIGAPYKSKRSRSKLRRRTVRHPLARLPRTIARGMVRGYQLIISPHFHSSCRYTPTCSQYAIEAIEKYGAGKGAVLAIHRISRCHPWGGHGYDPPRWFGEKSEAAAEEPERSPGTDQMAPAKPEGE